jgi:hypothetical protein
MMRRLSLNLSHPSMFWSCVLAMLLFARTAMAGDDPAEAKKYLEGLYAPYLNADTGAHNDCFDDAFDKCFAADLAKSMDAERKQTPEGEVGVLDFDPFIDGQDWKLSDLKITVKQGSDGLVGTAMFKNFSDAMKVEFDLIREGQAWKIKNMRGKDWDLRQLFAGY